MNQACLHKFGSGLLDRPEDWVLAASTVSTELPEGGIVVVSPLQGCRQEAFDALRAAGHGDEVRALQSAARVVARHLSIARGLGLDTPYFRAADPLLKRFAELIQGACLVGHASPRTQDAVLGVVGALGASLFTSLLQALGSPACRAERLPPATGLHARARPALSSAWCEHLVPGMILVVEGGLGLGEDGAVMSFGPGGSDLSAVALAEGLGIPEVRLWTADDGIQSADPSLVPEAQALPVLSLAEARALSGFGEKTLHPEVLAIAGRAGLVLTVANLHSQGSRTRITAEAPARAPGSVTSVAYKEGLHLLRLPPEASLERLSEMDRALRAAGASRFGAIAGPEGMLLVLKAEHAEAVHDLAALADAGVELSSGWALVALVGEGLRATPGSALRLLAPFQLELVEGLLAGSSPISVSFLVPEDRVANIVPRLHRLWIESPAYSPAIAQGLQ